MAVEVEDGHQGHQVVIDEGKEAIAQAIQVVCVVVVAAGEQETVWEEFA